MHTVTLLRHIIEHYQELVSFFIFLGLIVEGEFILISAGIFLHLHALDPMLTLAFIILGLISKTFLGYYLGTQIHKRWNHTKFLKYIEKRVSNIMPHFEEKPFWSIFISKFILGANNIVIIFSGYKKTDRQTYLKAELSSTIIWAPGLILIGYLFSYAAITLSHEVWRFAFIVLVLVILFIIFDKIVSWIYETFEELYHSKH